MGEKRKKLKNKKIHALIMFIAALFIITKTERQPKCPLTDEWIKNIC